MQTRREFIKTSLIGTGGLMLGGLALDSKIYARAKNANDIVKVGIVGFSDRCRGSLIPSFMNHAKELGFEIVAVSDIWKRRREEAFSPPRRRRASTSLRQSTHNRERPERRRRGARGPRGAPIC